MPYSNLHIGIIDSNHDLIALLLAIKNPYKVVKVVYYSHHVYLRTGVRESNCFMYNSEPILGQ